MEEQDDIVKEFIVESFEALDSLDRGLVTLEEDPNNTAVLNEIFRTVHTIKGTCGFLEFQKLESVAHVGENLLDSIRSHRLSVTQEIVSTLLALGDAIRSILQSLEQSGTEGDRDFSELVATMTRLNTPDGQSASTSEHHGAQPSSTSEVEQSPASSSESDEGDVATSYDPTNYALLEALLTDSSQKLPADLGTKSVATSTPADEASLTPETSAEPAFLSPQPEIKADIPKPTPPTTQAAPAATQPNATSAPSLSETSLRVDVNLLDQLMNLVGELVLARNQILQFTKGQTDSALLGASQRLNLITSELQEGVMKTRMQPIATVWDKFPRVVRDVARTCGKQVRLEMEGKDTDLDKTIIEAIKDPLTHIIRNSIDHGVEPPEDRQLKGKHPEGRILLRAFHEGGCVIIEVSDDGRGLQKDKILAKAIDRGLVRPERATTIPDKEVFGLIFHPGFSTADQVTNISGRGVGMDVVRSNIEKIGGVIDISSTQDRGTLMRIRIPLTLAIVPVLMVGSGRERFAIPQVNLVELLRITGDQLNNQIEEIQGALYCRLRGNLLPLVYLNRELKNSPAEEMSDNSEREAALSIVVVTAEGRQFGLVVESVHDTEEIVVKPLGKLLKGIEVFAGATILGDGKVALILDVADLAKRAGIHRTVTEEALTKEALLEDETGEQRSLLLVRVGETTRFAIPLEYVSRLEEFRLNEIELAGGRQVVQYRGKILPLIDLASYFNVTADEDREYLEVIVFQSRTEVVGIIVDRILDIAELHLDLTPVANKPGILGSAIIQKRVTDVIDIPSLLVACNVIMADYEELTHHDQLHEHLMEAQV